ncbi:hypothetical protein BH23CHL4_BH23CHL4_07500 [soil metagenome]
MAANTDRLARHDLNSTSFHAVDTSASRFGMLTPPRRDAPVPACRDARRKEPNSTYPFTKGKEAGRLGLKSAVCFKRLA